MPRMTWDYLTLFSERDDGQEVFIVKHYPQPRDRALESAALAHLGREGWELVAVVPAFAGTTGKINHQLYLKRPRPDSPAPTNGHAEPVAAGAHGSGQAGE
jgi:hypothetical protein